MTEPIITTLTEKKLVGKRMNMSLADNKTPELWKRFMMHRKEIKNNLSNDLFSLQDYHPSFDFKNFDIHATFDKWATIEVTDFNSIPDGMEPFVLPGGLYAVFHHKGDANTGPKIFGYIYGTWLPNSEYVLDNRPHFELLGEKYKNGDPNSEEDIYIPIKKK